MFSRTMILWLILILGNVAGQAEESTVTRLSSEIDHLIPPKVKIEKIGYGFRFTEGPVWIPVRHDEPAHLLFSDIPANRVYRYDPSVQPADTIRVAIDPVKLERFESGGVGGSNGLLLDLKERLVLLEHGNRRIARLNRDGSRSTLVDQFENKRLNSPNDGVYHSSGALFFTDPPYGLPKQDSDPAKELDHNGIYRLDIDGTLHLLKKIQRPNGIGLSPDEKVLYVASSDSSQKFWMAYRVSDDLTLDSGWIFFDARNFKDSGVPDGFVVDRKGNLWASGPGGVLIISPKGQHLGTIHFPEIPSNVTFDTDEKNLYVTARTGLYRLRLKD